MDERGNLFNEVMAKVKRQSSEKCLGVFKNPYKSISKLERHSEASTNSWKCLGPPGTLGDFWNPYKSISMLERHSGSFYKFIIKMFRTSRKSRGLLKSIQKYFQAEKTFWSFYKFRKMVRTSRNSRCLLKSIQEYF